ncbi:MAG TPA: excinuclease ABC subunit UvrA, partial [Burkholderiales bacterium]|nr:excinuclease ABC subunit UvrA [Burkholderiales bacterium]
MQVQLPTGDAIVIRGARQNNLKNLTLAIPTGELVVVTGVSGSGKSSLVFDTLYAEGQRRYVETFSPYARQFLDRMDKPQVDAIEGIPPAIAIDQTNPVRTSRSTVGTMTELNDHLKLLFARAASLHCRGCGRAVRRDTPESIYRALLERGLERAVVTFPVPIPRNFSEQEIEELLQRQGYTRLHSRSPERLEVIQDRIRLPAERARVVEALEAALRFGQGKVNVYAEGEAHRFSGDLHCADCDLHYAEPTPAMFSFNSPIGACEACRGFGRVIGVDFGLVVPDETKSLAEGAVRPWQTASFKECQDDLAKYAKKRAIPLDVPWNRLSPEQRDWVLEGEPEWVSWRKSWPGVWYGVRRFFKWLESKAYKMHIRVLLSKYRAYTECADCRGTRLKPDAQLWRLGGRSIHELMLQPIAGTQAFFRDLALPAPLDEATDLLLGEIRSRLGYLCDVGLGYLTLDRQSRTLSGGEVQRINLTTALGTSLVNTLFVLDEPSIGLHPRDMGRVIRVMQRLRDAGNTLVVVEHDPQIMFAADRILDMGPGAGERGGEIVFFGTPAGLKAQPSLTGEYLSGRRLAAPPATPQKPLRFLELLGAAEHNLKSLDVRIPLERLVCVTGVSGSGKSTLVQDVLYPALRKAMGKPTEAPGAHRALRGADAVSDVVMVDQSPIGKTARSNPASYVGAFDEIRKLFARAPVARERGYTPGTFSFNSGNGRCPTCSGCGFEHVEMQFLSDVYLRCPDCDGRRYRAEILEARLEGKSIADVLDMTVQEAARFFRRSEEVQRRLEPLIDVGLEYLRLGQPVPTLSGGEAQRLKLAGYLAEANAGGDPILFLFDEPTTGLHFEDVAKLLRALRRLLAAGHSLVVIEHNLDVIRACDWI